MTRAKALRILPRAYHILGARVLSILIETLDDCNQLRSKEDLRKSDPGRTGIALDTGGGQYVR